MAAVGRFLLICTVVGAPWAFGSIQPWPQFLLAAVVVGLSVLRAVEAIGMRADTPAHIPMASVAPLVLLLSAAFQLLPRESAPAAKMSHAVMAEAAAEFAGPDFTATGTLSPSSTRREAARLYVAMAAFLLAAQWFAGHRTHRMLFGALAVNGVALGAFGVVQSLSWNGMLFWTVELRHGGTPFASYVNRNNAAGYLNFCLGAAIGLAILLIGSRPSSSHGGQPRTPKLRTWDRARLAVSRLEGKHLALFSVLAVLVAAVLFSLSRGGAVAMVIAGAVVVAMAFRSLRWQSLTLITVAVAAIAVGLLTFAGHLESVDERMSTLSDPFAAAEGRLQHWNDTFGAVQDFPMLGTGFGTYRFANQPYQAHPAHAWYYNADNQWFEILVEMGGVGCAALLFGCLLIGTSSTYLLRLPDAHWRAAGAVGLFIILSQGLQALTDFGLLLPANGLTFAVLCGAVCGAACQAAEFHRLQVPISLSLARLEHRPSQALFAVVVAVAGAAFLLELFTATAADQARHEPLRINRDETQIGAIDAAIEQGTNALKFRPDDAELHQWIGQMWLRRYQLQMYRQLIEDLPDAAREAQKNGLWRASEVTAIAIRARQLERDGDAPGLERLKRVSAVAENLPNAQAHFEAALNHCTLSRGVALSLAELAFLDSGTTSTRSVGYLKKAAFTAPSTPSVLNEAAYLALASGDIGMADQCWRRVLEIAPEEGPRIWELASQGRTATEVIDETLPSSVEVLVGIALELPDEPARQLLVKRARDVLEKNPEGADDLTRARLAELQNLPDEAIRWYRLAFTESGWDIEDRLRLARLLHRQGRLSEAKVEYSVVLQRFPNRKDILAERAAVQDEMRRSDAEIDRSGHSQ